MITNWTVVNDTIAWINNLANPFTLSAQDGSKFLDLTNYQAGAPFGGVTPVDCDHGWQQLRPLLSTSEAYTAVWGGPPVSIHGYRRWHLPVCSNPSATQVSTWTLCSMAVHRDGGAPRRSRCLASAGVNYIGLDNVSVELGEGTTPASLCPEPAVDCGSSESAHWPWSPRLSAPLVRASAR